MFQSPLNRIHFGPDAISSHLGPSASISGGASPGPTFGGNSPTGQGGISGPVGPAGPATQPGPGQSPVYGPGGNMGDERPPSSYAPLHSSPVIHLPYIKPE